MTVTRGRAFGAAAMSATLLIGALGGSSLHPRVSTPAPTPTTPAPATSEDAQLLGLQSGPATTTPHGFTPTQILSHYDFDTLGDDAKHHAITGTGQTIGVVLWGNNVWAAPDMQSFITGFHLPGMLGLDGKSCTLSAYGAATPCFQVDNVGGTVPHTDTTPDESALDIEWSHAVAPGANIILVQAQTVYSAASKSWNPTSQGLDLAVQTAVKLGATVVSMSWGDPSMTAANAATWDQLSAGFVSGEGDFGYPETDYPAPDASVLSVGGTALAANGDEPAWSDTGGGDTAVSRPGYQLNWTTGTKREDNDVAYNAINYPIDYQTTSAPMSWYEVQGVSAGIPQWAGIVALADQVRNSNGKSNLDNEGLMDGLYLAAGENENDSGKINPSYFKDISTGCAYKYVAFGKAPTPTCAADAVKGYDPPTGLGTPDVANLVDYLGYDI